MTVAAAVLIVVIAWLAPRLAGDAADAQGARRAVWVLGCLVWASALLSLAPVWALGPRGVMATAYGYFGGAALRLILCLGGGIAIGKALDVSTQVVIVALAGVYVPLLMIEVGFVGRYMWLKDSLPVGGTAHCMEVPA